MSNITLENILCCMEKSAKENCDIYIVDASRKHDVVDDFEATDMKKIEEYKDSIICCIDYDDCIIITACVD